MVQVVIYTSSRLCSSTAISYNPRIKSAYCYKKSWFYFAGKYLFEGYFLSHMRLTRNSCSVRTGLLSDMSCNAKLPACLENQYSEHMILFGLELRPLVLLRYMQISQTLGKELYSPFKNVSHSSYFHEIRDIHKKIMGTIISIPDGNIIFPV